MQKKRFPSSLILGALWWGLASTAAAMGFGASTPAAVLGQALDFSVALRLAPGETVAPSCVRAEVQVGDARLAAEAVSTTLEWDGRADTATIRVRTRRAIDEPVLNVDVTAGCQTPLSRQFVLFADPPERQARAVLIEAALLLAPPAAAATPPDPAPPDRPTGSPSSTGPTAPGERAAPQAAAATPTPAPRRAVARAGAPVPPAPERASRVPAARPAPAPVARPRLRLDAVPPMPATPGPVVLSDEALALVEQTNEAVKAAIAAIKASQAQQAAQEQNLRQLRAQAAAQRQRLEELRAQAAAAEARTAWVMPLVLVCLALLGLAAWLWLRLRGFERERRAAWLQAARRPPAPPEPLPSSPPSSLPPPVAAERSVPNPAAAAPGAGLAPVHEPVPSVPAPAPVEAPAPEPRPQQTQALPPPAAAAPEGRDVSAEELIDLEQQAEFFVVLGQDEAAIDLLVSHLRDTGGGSPLPYLKLMDIYQRLGDAEAYGRLRDRFNLRFNAHAPDWGSRAQAGRTLEDYPQVIHWLQRVWPKPLDAMAELEAYLFRRDGGELFDLPAYRELLFLYALARERVDETASGPGRSVDVLLPLGDTPGFVDSSSRPYFAAAGADRSTEEITTPLDLDLTLDAPPRAEPSA